MSQKLGEGSIELAPESVTGVVGSLEGWATLTQDRRLGRLNPGERLRLGCPHARMARKAAGERGARSLGRPHSV
jgi:hypothetical protein